MSGSSFFVRGSFLVLLLTGLAAVFGGTFLWSRGELISASRQPAASAPSPAPQEATASRPSAASTMHMARRPAARDAAPIDSAAAIARNNEILASLTSAPAVLDAPKAMTVGQTRPVELRVGVGVPAGSLTNSGEPGNQQITGETAVSSNMMATLDGAGFTIRATTPAQLPMSEGHVTFWRWDVQAQEAGAHNLKATLYALIDDGGRSVSYQVKTYDQLVVVDVKAKTVSEWLDEIAKDADKIKGIVLTVGGLAMTIGGWLGFSRTRKTGETPNSS